MLWRFADCRLDVAQREFVRNGQPAHLTPKAFDLLSVLIADRPRVLSKDELIQRVWPDAFVADVNLTVLIAEIRAAIGDPARQPTLLRTVHRRGYAFIGAVTEMVRLPRVPLGGPTLVLTIGTRRILLDEGETTVGRDAACGIVINDVSVSRRHAALVAEGGRVRVVDASKNGTLINGRRMQGTEWINSGSVIKFGNVEATFAIEMPDGESTLTVDHADT